VPAGVTLCGASGGVPHSEHPIGTVLLAYGGRGQAEGEPLITLKPNAVVRNLVIHYPEHALSEVTPYPCSIRGMGSCARSRTSRSLTLTRRLTRAGGGTNCCRCCLPSAVCSLPLMHEQGQTFMSSCWA